MVTKRELFWATNYLIRAVTQSIAPKPTQGGANNSSPCPLKHRSRLFVNVNGISSSSGVYNLSSCSIATTTSSKNSSLFSVPKSVVLVVTLAL